MDYGEAYCNKTSRKYFYNIVSIANLKSIMKNGILSKYSLINSGEKSISIADEIIQNKRENITIPNGLKLHDYANLYFDYWNPMLSKKRSDNEEICVLGIDIEILNVKDVVLSNMNAASQYVFFYDVETGIENINFDSVFMRNWNNNDPYQYWINKSIKCAEVLVPYRIDVQYIKEIVVYSQEGKEKIVREIGSVVDIIVDPRLFF